MALYKVVAVRDEKAGVYRRPSFGLHLGEILRDWDQVVNDQQNIIAKFPEDFALYEIGIYDDEQGKITAKEPTQLSTAREAQRKPPTA